MPHTQKGRGELLPFCVSVKTIHMPADIRSAGGRAVRDYDPSKTLVSVS